jgi:hypothetical protein
MENANFFIGLRVTILSNAESLSMLAAFLVVLHWHLQPA